MITNSQSINKLPTTGLAQERFSVIVIGGDRAVDKRSQYCRIQWVNGKVFAEQTS